MAVICLIILPILVLGTELLPPECWINRAIRGVVEGDRFDE